MPPSHSLLCRRRLGLVLLLLASLLSKGWSLIRINKHPPSSAAANTQRFIRSQRQRQVRLAVVASTAAAASPAPAPATRGGRATGAAAPNHNEALSKKTLMQTTSLIVLILQNTSLSVFMRMSRIREAGASGSMYVSSTAVVLVEMIKFLVSLIIYLVIDAGDINAVLDDLKTGKELRLSVPAGLYVVQNNLQFLAANYLPAQIYQVFIQLKVFTTALLSERVLNRKHNKRQWAALGALFLGLCLVQLSLQSGGAVAGAVAGAAALPAFVSIGIGAVLLSSITSASAGVLTEKIVKESKNGLWRLNTQMSLFAFVIAAFACFIKDSGAIACNGGFFAGYNAVVWTTVLLQALGGLVIAFVVKNTSSVVKGFATSGSVVLSCLVSHFLLHDFAFTLQFVLGAVIVCGSAIAFSLASSPPSSLVVANITTSSAEAGDARSIL